MLAFYVKFTKQLILFALFTPQFVIRKLINIAELFLRRGGGNSLNQTYVQWGVGGTCTTNWDKQVSRGGNLKF